MACGIYNSYSGDDCGVDAVCVGQEEVPGVAPGGVFASKGDKGTERGG